VLLIQDSGLIRLMELIKQHFGVLELHKWCTTRTRFGYGNPVWWSGFPLGCTFRKCVFPDGLDKERPKIYLVPMRYHIGVPDASILQNSTDFRDESNETTPGTGNDENTIEHIGLASSNTYISHKVLLNLFRQQYGGFINPWWGVYL